MNEAQPLVPLWQFSRSSCGVRVPRPPADKHAIGRAAQPPQAATWQPGITRFAVYPRHLTPALPRDPRGAVSRLQRKSEG